MSNFFAGFRPLLMLVIIPITIIAGALYLNYYEHYVGMLQEPYNSLIIAYAFIGSSVVIIYSGRPLITPIEDHFQKKGYEDAVIEFKTLKIIFSVFFSLLIIMLIFARTYMVYEYPNAPFEVRFAAYWTNIFLGVTTVTVSLGSGVRILAQITKREFRFYLAIGYCITAIKKEDEFEKANHLFNSLDSYNKYLRRRSKIEIKDLNRIYATFLVSDIKKKNQIIESVSKSLEGDRLNLGRYLSSEYKVPESEFFAGESIAQKLKVVGASLSSYSYNYFNNLINNES